jgi:hypothetical protein
MDDIGPNYGWLDRLVHFFFCNWPRFLQGCSGHRPRGGV